MSIIKQTEEKAAAPKPGPPVPVLASQEVENELIIIRGQGPLISEGVYGEGPILETITPEEQVQRKAEAKKVEETAKADAEKAKAEAHKTEKADKAEPEKDKAEAHKIEVLHKPEDKK